MKTIQQNNPDSTEVLALLIGEVDDDSRNISSSIIIFREIKLYKPGQAGGK